MLILSEEMVQTKWILIIYYLLFNYQNEYMTV